MSRQRECFVANSSSSSFIVAVNKGNLKIKLEMEVDLEKYADKTISTIEELIYYFKEDMCYSVEELEENEEYQNAKRAIQDGKTVLIGSFSNESGDDLEYFLCENGLKDNINSKDLVIIQSEGGY